MKRLVITLAFAGSIFPALASAVSLEEYDISGHWSGTWKNLNKEGGGPAELQVKEKDSGKLKGEITLRETNRGDFSFKANGSRNGTKISLKPHGAPTELEIIRQEDGTIALVGGYKVESGKSKGSEGEYFFEQSEEEK